MNRPDFRTLPELPGHPSFRWVGSCYMEQEQYDTELWHIVKSYERDDGSTGHYWSARLSGLQRYSRLVAERRERRITASRTRREADDEWSSHVASLLDNRSE